MFWYKHDLYLRKVALREPFDFKMVVQGKTMLTHRIMIKVSKIWRNFQGKQG